MAENKIDKEEIADVQTWTIPAMDEGLTEVIVALESDIKHNKWRIFALRVALVNHELKNGAETYHQASIRAANDLDLVGWGYRTFSDAYQKARKQANNHPEMREYQDIFKAVPGQVVVLPEDADWVPSDGGNNRRHARFKTYEALVKAYPDGPDRSSSEAYAGSHDMSVVNKKTKGWDAYKFYEQDHEWVLAAECPYDFENLESLLEKYPEGYFEGEHQFKSKSFIVMGTVPDHPEFPRIFTWEQDWDSDDESEFKWSPHAIKTALQIEQELEQMWWTLKGLQSEIDMAYVTDAGDFERGIPKAAKFAEINGMMLEDLLNMLRAGSEGHISYLRKPDESSHVPKGKEPMELERGGDWDDAFARLLAQQDQQENPDDADQS